MCVCKLCCFSYLFQEEKNHLDPVPVHRTAFTFAVGNQQSPRQIYWPGPADKLLLQQMIMEVSGVARMHAVNPKQVALYGYITMPTPFAHLQYIAGGKWLKV